MEYNIIPDKEFKELMEKLAKLQTDLNERDAKISNLEKDILISKQSLISKENSIKEKNKIINEYKQKLAEFQEKRVVNMIEEMIQYQPEKNNMGFTIHHDQIEHLNETFAQMQNEATKGENYKELLESLKSKEVILDTVIKGLENVISDNENQIRRLEREIRILKRKAEENAEEFQECESLKDDFEKKCKLLKKERRALNESLKSKENSIKEKDIIIDEYKQNIAEFREIYKNIEIEKIDKEIENQKIEIEKKKTKIENYNRQVEYLKLDNEKKQQAIVNMRENTKSTSEEKVDRSDFKMLQNEIGAKDLKIVNLNEVFDKQCAEYESAESENDRMKKPTISSSLQKRQ